LPAGQAPAAIAQVLLDQDMDIIYAYRPINRGIRINDDQRQIFAELPTSADGSQGDLFGQIGRADLFLEFSKYFSRSVPSRLIGSFETNTISDRFSGSFPPSFTSSR